MTKEQLIQRLTSILDNPTKVEQEEPFACALDVLVEYADDPQVERLLNLIEERQVEVGAKEETDEE